MIGNREEPMCIAGVFGGLESGISESTTGVFLESACFDPVFVRKTARRHGLNTDASFRYERGTDPNIVIYALKLAALLIKMCIRDRYCLDRQTHSGRTSVHHTAYRFSVRLPEGSQRV